MHKMIADRYMIASSLGEGGMADVFLAIDTVLNREVAVKVLRGELSKDPVTLLRFQREANAVSKLNHSNVVDVYDVGEYEGKHYIVMEYIRGRTLKQLISQRGALHQGEAVNIMIQLTSAVQHAHENNIIHRDIKPQNVLLKDDGTVKITDFGIALAHDTVQLTQNDAVLGSAHYLAPETTRGETTTNQVDIYALGIVFYELLTGSVPFHGENPVQIAMKHLREDIPSVCEFNPTLPQSVENIIIKATVKNRKNRYQSARDMLYDLQCCLLPEYAHLEKLTFVDDNEPTKVINNKKMKPQGRKEKIIPIEEDEDEEDEKPHSKLSKPLVLVLGILVIVGIASFIFLSGILDTGKMIRIPTIANSQTQEEAIQTLIESGFKKENIKIKEELSDGVKKGYAITVSPSVGSKAKNSATITLSVSKGVYVLVKDYKNYKLSDVEAELSKESPNLKLKITYKQVPNVTPGYIVEQSNLEIGEKLDPDKQYTLHVSVTQLMKFKIENIVGKTVDEARDIINKATGVNPVLNAMSYDGLSKEEQALVKIGDVVKVVPAEGTEYIQQIGDKANQITIYYYE